MPSSVWSYLQVIVDNPEQFTTYIIVGVIWIFFARQTPPEDISHILSSAFYFAT